MAKIALDLTSRPFVSFVSISIVIFLSKICLVMHGAWTPHKESLMEDVSGMICLSCEVKIVQKIFYLGFM